jgi:pyruvate/2-oxoglutarate dehydrogenase complex dihydrolipoamide dehydrogenase (E3) component
MRQGGNGKNMKVFDYDLIVIGGGPAGIVAAKIAKGIGKKAAMVEKDKIGGDCTWYGCVPSKTLIRAASVAHLAKNLNDYGLEFKGEQILNTEHVLKHVRNVIQNVYKSEQPEVFEKLGIKVFFGSPEFIDNHQILIGSERLSSKNFIIATGSSPFIPPIMGLNTTPYLTNETIFSLERLPASMILLGGGPIGIELSQALNRLGVNTTVIEMSDRILFREDKELADILTNHLKKEGVNILTKTKAVTFAEKDSKRVVTAQNEEGSLKEIEADSVMVAVGRKPNVGGLKLENAGVNYTPKGIIADERLRTTAPNIYACGDIVGPYQFSHMAEYQALTATLNAFLPIKRKVNYHNVLWCTFTDPELAHTGLTEEEARERYGNTIKIYSYDYSHVDRAQADLSTIGKSKFICDKKGKLIGAHILGHLAGETMHEVQLLKSLNIPFTKIAPVIHAYPTYSDVVKRPSGQAYVEKLQSNLFIKLMKKIFS